MPVRWSYREKSVKNACGFWDQLKEVRPNWHDALMMSYLEHKDNSSIGKELGATPALVSKWKERGQRWLREEYEKQNDMTPKSNDRK